MLNSVYLASLRVFRPIRANAHSLFKPPFIFLSFLSFQMTLQIRCGYWVQGAGQT